MQISQSTTPAQAPPSASASGAGSTGQTLSLTFTAPKVIGGSSSQPAQTPPSIRNTRMSGKSRPLTGRTASEPSPSVIKHRTSPSEPRKSKATFTTSLDFPGIVEQIPPLLISAVAEESADLQRSQRRSKVEAITKLDRANTPVQVNATATAGPAGTSFLPPSAQPQPIAGPSVLRNPLNKPPVVNPPFSMDSVRTKGPRHPPSRSHSRLFGLKECPSYYPTENQFRDPMAYIASIADQAQKYGICKIVPPEGWQMPFSMETETFKFKTRLQRLNQLEAASRAKVNFLEQLHMFHMQQGDSQITIPTIDRQLLDVYRLRKEVNKAGGHLELNRTQGWQAITEMLGFKPAWWAHVKDAYMRVVYPFDKWATRAKSATNSPFTPKTNTKSAQPPAFSTDTPPSPSAAARMTGMRASPRTRMSASVASALNVKPSISTSPLSTAASLPGASRESFYSAIELTRPASAAPVLSTLKIKVPGFSSLDGSESDLSEEDSALSEESPARKPPPTPVYKKGDICEVCRGDDGDDKLLLCDSCDRGFHIYCLDPPLAAVPTNEEWFCTTCLLSQGDDFGFEDGEDHSVASFQARDAAFSHSWWNRHRPPSSPGQNLNANLYPDPNPMMRTFGKVSVTEDDVEREFWRLTESASDTVEVEYGADIHSTTHGSAGPTMETHPLDPYAASPWNLNNMPILPDSLLRYIRSDISGMTVPWIYLGMMFSTFCWHNEDHYTYSVNYMYWGETKTWYGCSGDDAEKFEAAMKSEAPELFEQQPGLLFQLVTMMNPGRLRDAGVDVFACDQRPNEFVITFPKAYHCGFNHGINMNEAVNFALPDWLRDGKQSVVRYKEYLKPPVFSHNELLVTITLYSETIRTALWLKDSLTEMVELEAQRRDKLRITCPTLQETLTEDDVPEEQYQCAVCKGFCYLAQITCACTKLVSCLDHAHQLCACAITKKTLRKRYSEAQLEEILAIVLARAAQPENWRNRFYALLESPRPALKSMRALLTDGERIAYPMHEVQSLRPLVDRANAWVERVSAVLTRKATGRRRKGGNVKDEDDDMVDRSPEALRALLTEAERMAFDTMEIPQLRQALLSIESFRSEAAVIISTPENELDLDKCKTVLILGESLNLDMPEIAAIQTIINRLGWFRKVEEEVDDRTLDYDDVIGLLAKAEEYEVPSEHPTVVELRRRRQRGADWLAAAKKTLAADAIALEDITNLIEGQDLIPITADIMRQLESIRKTVLNWQTSAKNLLSSNGSTLAASRLCKSVATASAPINRVRIPEIASLQEELDYHSRWSEAMGKLLEVPPNKVANTINMIKRDFASNLSADDEEPNDDHTCYCRSPPGAIMVTCKRCLVEYHPKCVGISPKNSNLPFQCEICERLLPPIYPSLDKFMALAQSRRWNFIITPPDFIAAQEIATLGLRAAYLILLLCDPNNVAIPQNDTEKLQHWITKIYQLPLTFEVENVSKGERVVLVTQLFHRLQQATKTNLGITNGNTKEKHTRTRGRKARFVLAQSYPREFHCICDKPQDPPSASDVNVPEIPMVPPTATCFKCGQGYHTTCVKAPIEALEPENRWRCPCCAVKEAKYYSKVVEVRVQLKDQLGTEECIDYRSTITDYSFTPIRVNPQPFAGDIIHLECTNFIPPVIPEDHPANTNVNTNGTTNTNTNVNGDVQGRDRESTSVKGEQVDERQQPARKRRKIRTSQALFMNEKDTATASAPASPRLLTVNGHVQSNGYNTHNSYSSPTSMPANPIGNSNGINGHNGASSVQSHHMSNSNSNSNDGVGTGAEPGPPTIAQQLQRQSSSPTARPHASPWLINRPTSEPDRLTETEMPSSTHLPILVEGSRQTSPIAPPPHVLPDILDIDRNAKQEDVVNSRSSSAGSAIGVQIPQPQSGTPPPQSTITAMEVETNSPHRASSPVKQSSIMAESVSSMNKKHIFANNAAVQSVPMAGSGLGSSGSGRRKSGSVEDPIDVDDAGDRGRSPEKAIIVED